MYRVGCVNGASEVCMEWVEECSASSAWCPWFKSQFDKLAGFFFAWVKMTEVNWRHLKVKFTQQFSLVVHLVLMNHERIRSFGEDVKPLVPSMGDPYLYMYLTVWFKKSRVFTLTVPDRPGENWEIGEFPSKVVYHCQTVGYTLEVQPLKCNKIKLYKIK